MLFGSSIYKTQFLNAQWQKNVHQRALIRATKNVKNLEKMMNQQKQLNRNMALASKDAMIAEALRGCGYNGICSAAELNNLGQAERTAYLSAFNTVSASVTQEISAQTEYCDECADLTNESILEAAKNEEENEQIEVDYWTNMEQFFQKLVEQAEKWFQSSLQLLFGGHGH